MIWISRSLGVSGGHGEKFVVAPLQAMLAMPFSVSAAVQLSQAKWMHLNFLLQSNHVAWAT
jgi:hypothetical protein